MNTKPNSDAGEGRPAATCSAWRVPQCPSSFGTWLDTGICGGLVIVLYRGTHGWRTPESMPHVLLPHQIYVQNLAPIAAYPTREIVAVGLRSGTWVTLWAEEDREVSIPLPNK